MSANAIKRSKLATVAGAWGATCLFLAVAGLLMKGAYPRISFEWLVLYGALLGTGALPLGLAALYTTLRGLRSGAPLAWFGCIVGLLLIAALLAWAYLPH